jgi:hypothetical protein
VGPRAGLDMCGKSRPTGIRSPDRPARSQSLYRLSYLYGQTVRTTTLPWHFLSFDAFQTRSETVKFSIRVREVPGSNLDAV